jgi:hypothetical protein
LEVFNPSKHLKFIRNSKAESQMKTPLLRTIGPALHKGIVRKKGWVEICENRVRQTIDYPLLTTE